MTLTLAEADSIVNAAIAKARQLNVNVSVAVCDEYGHLMARLNAWMGLMRRSTGSRSERPSSPQAPGSRAATSRGSSIIRRPLTLLGMEGLGYGFVADCRFSEAAGSRAPAASTEHYPASKMKSAHAPELPAS